MIVSTSTKSFIETQFPVSKLSKESYKERKAGSGQTLTGLGKWWGRKPLILVRAAILGLLFPASDDPQKDREIFLKLLTMDDEGLWRRKSKAIPLKELCTRLTREEREQWLESASESCKPAFKKTVMRQDREALQHTIFNRLSYDEKLVYCDRPEQIDGPSEVAWDDINDHLGTDAQTLPGPSAAVGRTAIRPCPARGGCVLRRGQRAVRSGASGV